MTERDIINAARQAARFVGPLKLKRREMLAIRCERQPASSYESCRALAFNTFAGRRVQFAASPAGDDWCAECAKRHRLKRELKSLGRRHENYLRSLWATVERVPDARGVL